MVRLPPVARSPICKDHPGGLPYNADYKVLWAEHMRSGWGAELERQALTVGLNSVFWDATTTLV